MVHACSQPWDGLPARPCHIQPPDHKGGHCRPLADQRGPMGASHSQHFGLLLGKVVALPLDNWQVESIPARPPGMGVRVHSSHTGASPPGPAKDSSFEGKGKVNATPGWGGAEERF